MCLNRRYFLSIVLVQFMNDRVLARIYGILIPSIEVFACVTVYVAGFKIEKFKVVVYVSEILKMLFYMDFR